jgi:hypothetical protein
MSRGIVAVPKICEARAGGIDDMREQKRSVERFVPLLRKLMPQAKLGLAMLLLLTACSPEPRWASVPNGKAGEFIDVSDIAAAGPVRRASIKIVFTTPQSGDASQGNRRVVEIVFRQAFNCAGNTQRTEAMTFHYANGVVFDVPADQLPSHDWKPVEPDDGKPELDFTCRQQRD